MTDVNDFNDIRRAIQGTPLKAAVGSRVRVEIRQSRDVRSPPVVVWRGEVFKVRPINKNLYVRRDGSEPSHYYLFTRYGGPAAGGMFVPNNWQLVVDEQPNTMEAT